MKGEDGLGPTLEMIGMPVFCFGRVWVIEGINYLGDYDMVRFHTGRRVWQHSSISGHPLPREHNHYWEPIGPEYQKRMKKAVTGWQRLDHWLDDRKKRARQYRRAQAYKSVLIRFFVRAQRVRPRRDRAMRRQNQF